jgi:PAS domain S-box-containing protein
MMRKRKKAPHGAPSRRPAARPAGKQARRRTEHAYASSPALRLIYDTAPVGLAVLSADCRYVRINQRLTEICGIPVADHIGRTVRETVPEVAEQVERIVAAVMRTGRPVTGVEVHGQRADRLNTDHVWITHWHPLKDPRGRIVGVNVVAEEVTERKRAEAALAKREQELRESEARFHTLADNISQLAWTADHTGWIYWYNRRWHDYTGTTLEEMQGWGWRAVHHPDHVDRVVQRISRCFLTGEPWEDTFPLRGRDGGYRWFLSRAQPIRDGDGEVIHWFGTHTDVTEQLEAEKALRELNETLEQRVEVETRERLRIWNVSEDLLAVADLDGRILSANPAWTATLGWPQSDLVGGTSEWLLHPDDRDKAEVEQRRLAGGHKTVRFEGRLRHKDGSYRWLSWKAVPDQGRVYAMGRDVTDLRHAEDDLRHVRAELALVSRRTMVAAMTASIAHEIKQPLGAIVANANAGLRWLARSPPVIDEALETFRDIVADGHRASDVIQSLRDMFDGREQPGEPIDVNALIRDTVAIVRGELDAAAIAAHLDLAPQLPPVPARRGQVQQVILNLLTNATDSMRAVTDRKRVLRVTSEAAGTDSIAVSVQDSGTGIAADDAARIFDPFYTTKSHGMGMGLSICKSIVEAHGGRLTVATQASEGAIFRFVLPAGRPPEDQPGSR